MCKNSKNYFQPDSYHFSEDSLFLKEAVLSDYSFKKSSLTNLLDLGAGSGIISLEIVKEVGLCNFNFIDLIEVQSVFIESLKKNKQKICKNSQIRIFMGNYFCYPLTGQYDLIVCNPPYFSENSHRTPVNKTKLKCDFYKVGEREKLFSLFVKALTKDGRVYFLQSKKSKEELLKCWQYMNVFQWRLGATKLRENKSVIVFKLWKL